MLTEIIENDIKVQYLKKYCAQLRMQILYDDENRFYMGHEQREKFDETTKGKNLFKIKDVIRENTEIYVYLVVNKNCLSIDGSFFWHC